MFCNLLFIIGDPNGNRTHVSGVRGQRPRPLDDGTMIFQNNRRSYIREIPGDVNYYFILKLVARVSFPA
jgi:hypothetical protein